MTRYRFNKVRERSRLKQSISRLTTIILFPELEKLVSTLHMASVYTLLSEFPRAHQIVISNLTHFKKILSGSSQGRYGREKALEIRNAARISVGSSISVKSLELKHTIPLFHELDKEIEEIERTIDEITDTVNSTVTTIPGHGKRMGL